MLLKLDLLKQEISRIKKLADGVCSTLKGAIARIQGFTSKQTNRDEIKIKEYLWDETTGLPESFAPEETDEKTDTVFSHLLTNARYNT